MPKAESKLEIDFSLLLGAQFYIWVLVLPLPIALQSLGESKASWPKRETLRTNLPLHRRWGMRWSRCTTVGSRILPPRGLVIDWRAKNKRRKQSSLAMVELDGSGDWLSRYT